MYTQIQVAVTIVVAESNPITITYMYTAPITYSL